MTTRTTLLALAVAATLTACGGGNDTSSTAQAAADATQELKRGGTGGGGGGGGGNDCIGSCTGGGGTPVVGATNPLPTTAPAPDILYRESFGPGPEQLRPKGGKGDMRSAFLHTTIGGFWVEWPGSKNTQWIGANGDQSWKFAGADGNPYEGPTPLQPGEGYGGIAFSEVFDVVNPVYPSLLLPVSLPTTRWAVSAEGTPMGGVNFGSYIALGLTDSSVTLSNLTSVGKVALILRRATLASSLTYELWGGVGGRSLLASGAMEDMTWNHMVLAYDPATRQVTASINETVIGTFGINLGAPRYAGFEGLGMMDNFIIRKLP